MTIDSSNYNTKCKLRAISISKNMKEEENEGLKTVECLRGRLLAERQVSRSTKEATELITRKMEELERNLKEEIRLREKAEKRLKYLMKKLEFMKGSRSFEKLTSSEGSCLSSICTSTSKEEEESQGNDQEESSSNLKDISSGEASSVVASNSSHEEELKEDNEFPWYSDIT